MPHLNAFAILAGALCAALLELLFLRRWYAYRDFETYPQMLGHFLYWLAHGFRYRYPDRRIRTIILWQNGFTMVFDKQGRQMPSYQGPYRDPRLRARIDAARGQVPIVRRTWPSTAVEFYAGTVVDPREEHQ
jgi:hypothetical protein